MNWRRIAVLFFRGTAAMVLLLWLADDVFARAGGGGGFSGGGGGGGFSGGGGSGGGGGDGGAELIWLFFQLCYHYPMIGIPLLVLVVAFFVYSGLQGNEVRRSRVIRRGNAAFDAYRARDALAVMRGDDANFDDPAFCKRVGDAFDKIQQAWSEQQLEPMRPFVSDGIFERFSLQIQEQKDLGYRNVMEDVVVRGTRLAEAVAEPHFVVVTVRISASATDYRVALDTGREIPGSRRGESFVEFWTLLRRRGAQTEPGKPGLIEGACPNCGTPIEMNQSARCESCGSLLRSGEHDWVLVEITQQSEWRARGGREAPGVAAFRREKDPGLNVPHLEDRASVMFWRKAMADRLGDVAPLRKMATDAMCERYAEQLRAQQGFYRGDCAVGSVDLLGVLAGEPHDRAVVQVVWSGRQYQRVGDGPPQQRSSSALSRTLFVLGRRSGARTDVDHSVSSAHCPGCGAPESELAANSCEFCGEPLADGRTDWVLLEIVAIASQTGQALLAELRALPPEAEVEAAPTAPGVERPSATEPRASELLRWMIHTAMVDDGTIEPRERDAIERAMQRHGIAPAHLDRLIEAATSGQNDLPQPSDREEAMRWLEAIADISLSDGRLHAAEKRLLVRLGEKLSFGRHDLNLLLRRRKKALFRRAKEELARGG